MYSAVSGAYAGIPIGQSCSRVQQVTVCMVIVMETTHSGMYNCPLGV